MNIFLTVAYDGTNYCGWQRQNNGITIQAMLEAALCEIFKEQISVCGCSRTDSGVHALSQGVAFKISNIKIPLEKLPQVINKSLPCDIVVKKAVCVNDDFNPRFNATKKIYLYKIYNSKFKDPLLRNYTWHIEQLLNIEKMQEAAKHFIGTYDFKAFSATGSDRKTTVRTLYNVSVEKLDNVITIMVEGNGFLYNMVRIIAGTLVYVGLLKIEPSEIKSIILEGERKKAGKTAPACGLVLYDVSY